MPIHNSGNLYVEKRLSSREVSEPEAILRLKSEADLLGHLGGLDGIVPRLLERGEDDRGPWHRIERITIPTLAARIHHHASEASPPFFTERAVRTAFEALAKLHDACDSAGQRLDVVHADLSPSNVAVDDSGMTAVILDFDLAWWRGAPNRSDGAFRGTIAYVAPEVAQGERPTIRSDLFSLAATLLHVMTGQSPRPIREDLAFAAHLMMAAEQPLVLPNRSGDDRRYTLVGQCLAHDPRDRPASAAELLKSFAMDG